MRRLGGLAVAGGCLAVLVLAAGLRADGRGHGTHQQLGLPACGWAAVLDAPCPTCGMTTAFAHAAGGDLAASAITQPLGAALAVVAATLVIGGGHVALTGVDTLRLLRPLGGRRWLWIGLGSLLAAWGYKMVMW